MGLGMNRPLDMLRSIARRSERSPSEKAFLSLNSFISSPDTAVDRHEPASRQTIGHHEKNEGNERTRLADDPEERAAFVEHDGGAPRSWAEGFAALCAMPPAPGFSAARWERIIDATGRFLDRWAAEAVRCGWSDLDVFGCDPARPDARFDCMGLVLLLDRCELVGIDDNGADLRTITGAQHRFRRRPLPASTVSLSELMRR
jgi:hypothetical protein